MTQKRDDRDSGGKDYEPVIHTDHWRFEKRLSLDTLVAIVGVSLVVGGPVLVWGRAMESRVQALEVIQEQRAKQEIARDLDARDQRISILGRMDKIDEQVTQLRIEVGKVTAVTAPTLPPVVGKR